MLAFMNIQNLPNHQQSAEWEEMMQEIDLLLEKVYLKAQQERGDKATLWLQEEVKRFAEEVKKNVPDYDKYVAYHRLVSSSSYYEMAPKLDLPEPYGVKGFLEKLVA